MMFYLLALCVCLAVLFLALAGASLLVWTLRGMIAAMLRSWAPAPAARLLFAVRVLPFFLALGLTLGLALPAFLNYEPRSSGETMSARLLLLSVAGAVTLMVMAVRGWRVLWATVRAEQRWRAGSEEYWINAGGSQLPLHYVDGPSGLLAVTGFFRPKVFVAKDVAQMLSPDELSAALAHEVAHMHFYDNLKQLLLKITRPPRWAGGVDMDDAWTNVSEVAADEAALARGASALDLAAALVKMGALQRAGTTGERIAASHLLPIGSAVEMRVARLQKALQGELAEPKIKSGGKHWRIIGTIMLPAAYVATIITLLPTIHEALELLVR
jgi:Zn-dependent protease with chaperone function